MDSQNSLPYHSDVDGTPNRPCKDRHRSAECVGLWAPFPTALDAMAELSLDAASTWLLDIRNTADFLGTFASYLLAAGEHQTWGTIKHAADGCTDLAELIKAYIFHHPDQRDD